MSLEKKFIRISEAAKLMGVSIDTLRNWEASGKLIPYRTAGGHRRYLESVILGYYEQHKLG
jgi:excisionase family DNA binding protein